MAHLIVLVVVMVWNRNPYKPKKTSTPQSSRPLLLPLPSFHISLSFILPSRNPHGLFPPLLILLILIFVVALVWVCMRKAGKLASFLGTIKGLKQVEVNLFFCTSN